MKKKKIIIAIVAVQIIICIAVGVVFAVKNKKPTDDFIAEGEMTVDAQILAKQDLSDSVYVTGTVESQNVMAVTSELQAKIENINVNVGDKVEVGDELCSFDKEDIQNQINELRNQNSQSGQDVNHQKDAAARELQRTREEAAANIAVAQEIYDDAKKEYDKAKKDPEISQEDLLSLKREYNNAKQALQATKNEASSSIGAAEDALNSANSVTNDTSDVDKEIAELQKQLDKTVIKAEQAGIITQLSVAKGEITSTGALMQIADNENLRIKVPIREKDILKMQEGMKAKITSDALPDTLIEGTVSQVINFTTETGGGDYYEADSDGGGAGGYSAYVDVEPGSELLLGMSVKVEISLDAAGEKLAVPYDAILEEDSSYVFRAVPQDDGNYLIEKISIEKGSSNDYYTEIISSQLSEGDYIIITPWAVMEGDTIPVNIVDNVDIQVDNTDDMEDTGEFEEF